MNAATNPKFLTLEASLQGELTDVERVAVLCGMAYTLRNNDPERALRLVGEALVLATRINSAWGMAECEFTRGVVECCQGDYETALVRLFRAVDAFYEAEERFGAARALRWIGIGYVRIGMYKTALEYLAQARTISEEIAEAASEPLCSAARFHEAQSWNNIGDVYFGLRDFHAALRYYRETVRMLESFDDLEQKAIVLNSIASANTEIKEYSRALLYYQQSLAIRKQLGDTMGIGTTMAGIAYTYGEQGKFAEALQTYFEVLDSAERSGTKLGIAWSNLGVGNVYLKSGRFDKALQYLHRSESVVQEELPIFGAAAELFKSLYECYKGKGDTEQALHYFERYTEIFERTTTEDNKRTIAAMQRGFEIEKAQKEAEIYRLKNVELVHANKQNEELLLNILPVPIAARLKNGTTRIAEKFEHVTVLFADIVGFTHLSARTAPETLVGALDVVFSLFDELAQHYGLEKIKTIGDAYMVVGGAPERRNDHCEAVAKFALDVMARFEAMSGGDAGSHNTNCTDEQAALSGLKIRIGIHTGEAVAGVIGKKKFSYDLWGDTVNTASRMESHSEAGKIHITEEVYRALCNGVSNGQFTFEERGEIEVKGKGLMQTWFLVSANQDALSTLHPPLASSHAR
jgi:class 3 adenylate cyclase/tetratricopeptide (TPR) repeat protein